jgi:adenine/guanine phosphoribosyltransferase-like PRPP-binding protein
VTAQVTHPCPLVVPISLYTIPGELHATLRRYKDARCPDRRERDALAVGDLLSRFLERHLGCLSGGAGGVDLITTVPSSAGRPSPHPLAGALELVPRLAAPLEETLVRGPVALGHARASDHGFEVRRSVEGAKVVLVDDTLTTGARAQSAASALTAWGAQVLAVVVVGRVVDPLHSLAARRWWRDHAGQPFDLERCCLEAKPDARESAGDGQPPPERGYV